MNALKKIQPGDTIGIAAPSFAIGKYAGDFKLGIKILKSAGFKIKYCSNISSSYYSSAGTKFERSRGVNDLFKDKEVKAIICSIGGCTANQTLAFLNFDLVKENPKIFIGSSDNTNLLLSFLKKSNLPVFYGPNIINLPHISEKSFLFLFRLITGEADLAFPKQMVIINHGKARGKLIGGNLMVLNDLVASDFSPEFKNSIFLWEDIIEEIGDIEYQIERSKLYGIMDKISGMVVGNIQIRKRGDRSIDDILTEMAKEYSFPIVRVDYFGHSVEEFYTFPLGVEVEINTEENKLEIIGDLFSK